MAVRPAAERDLAALLPLLRAYCEFYESDPADEGLERMARALIAAPEDQAFLLVATADPAGAATAVRPEAATADPARDADPADPSGEVIGFAACQWKWSSLRGARVVVLDDLFVAERARGAGHADALIAAAAEIARRHGAPMLTWLTGPDNHRAQAVYNRVGGTSEPMLEYELDLHLTPNGS